MGGSIILHHLRGHWVPVPDPLDRYADAALVVLAVLAVAVCVASVVKWRRGKHRADPALKAVADRMVMVEKAYASARSLPGRVAAGEDRLDRVEYLMTEALDLVVEAFGEAGVTVPEKFEKARRRPAWLRGVISGGGGAA